MDVFWQFMAVLVGITIVIILVRILTSSIIVQDHENAVVYRNGLYEKTLKPGLQNLIMLNRKVVRVDMRSRSFVLKDQEILTADKITMRITLAVIYKINDAYLSLSQSTNYQEQLYLYLQLALRDLVGSLDVDQALTKRKEIGEQIMESVLPRAKELGLELDTASIRDISFPGELKNVFAQVVSARQEGLALLEKARAESAALRNLANTANLLDEHPAIYQLRLLQAVEKSKGNTLILNTSPDVKPMVSTPRG